MSREIETNNPQICLEADDLDNGASHVYIAGYTTDAGNLAAQIISFQRGPVGETGVNGITNELLLQVLIDRLQCFQVGKFACYENKLALACCRDALGALNDRTAQRKARGVEGTHEL